MIYNDWKCIFNQRKEKKRKDHTSMPLFEENLICRVIIHFYYWWLMKKYIRYFCMESCLFLSLASCLQLKGRLWPRLDWTAHKTIFMWKKSQDGQTNTCCSNLKVPLVCFELPSMRLVVKLIKDASIFVFLIFVQAKEKGCFCLCYPNLLTLAMDRGGCHFTA